MSPFQLKFFLLNKNWYFPKIVLFNLILPDDNELHYYEDPKTVIQRLRMTSGPFRKRRSSNTTFPDLQITEIHSFEDYLNHAHVHHDDHLAIWSIEKTLTPSTPKSFTLDGYCYICQTKVDFLIDFKNAFNFEGELLPNWRERVLCPNCHLNNRMRATKHIFDHICRPHPRASIFIAEQTTPLYTCFKQTFPHIQGSEFLGDSKYPGSYHLKMIRKFTFKKIRHEDLTHLSFENGRFDYILAFDVFEHIPQYKKALAECYRCLKEGGILFFSVPFVKTAEKNVIRATISDTGRVTHLLPPEYHGNPLSPSGLLCYYHFGWELVGELHSVGFQDTKILLYWSRELGYLGGEQILFTATKPAL